MNNSPINMKLKQASLIAKEFVSNLSEKLNDYDIPVKTQLETPIIRIGLDGHIKPFQIGTLRTLKKTASMKIVFIEDETGIGYSLIFKVKGITFTVDITANIDYMFDYFMKKLINLRLTAY